mmetsp:Transcript_27877/g.28146  ORF Transcript_27877/g.28146 Transcript_27877/m.28146 type:complete len:104 (+) Transcript_27877:162-473(+)
MGVSPKPHSFRVPLTAPSPWKISVVSRYKMTMAKKKPRELMDDGNRDRDKKPRRDMDLHSLLELYERGREIRQKIHEINSVRHSLLWMLKKSTQYELQQNHLP